MRTVLDQFKKLSRIDYESSAHSQSTDLSEAVDGLLGLIGSIDLDDLKTINQLLSVVAELGRVEQQAFWQLNNRLLQPLKQLMADTKAGGQVACLLQKLQQVVVKIQPPDSQRITLRQRFVLLFSAFSSPWEMWLAEYPEQKQKLMILVDQLNAEKSQLKRDNHILNVDRDQISSAVKNLEYVCDLVSLFEQKFKSSANFDEVFNQQLLSSVQRRLLELQQQLLIGRQSVMTLDLLIKQNQSLVNSIEQAVYSTTSALNVATSVALVSKKQKVLDSDHSRVNDLIDGDKLRQAQLLIEQSLQQMHQVQSETASVSDDIQSQSIKPEINE